MSPFRAVNDIALLLKNDEELLQLRAYINPSQLQFDGPSIGFPYLNPPAQMSLLSAQNKKS